jgi:hypothetical protein
MDKQGVSKIVIPATVRGIYGTGGRQGSGRSTGRKGKAGGRRWDWHRWTHINPLFRIAPRQTQQNTILQTNDSYMPDRDTSF